MQDLEAQLASHAAKAQELQNGEQGLARALEQLRLRLHKGTARLWAAGQQQQAMAGWEDRSTADAEGDAGSVPSGLADGDGRLDTCGRLEQETQDAHQQQQETLGKDGPQCQVQLPLQDTLVSLGVGVQDMLDAVNAASTAVAAMARGLRTAHVQLQQVICWSG